MITEQYKREIIKAFAYGKTAEQVAEATDLSVDEAEQLRKDNISQIEKKRAELIEEGFM